MGSFLATIADRSGATVGHVINSQKGLPKIVINSRWQRIADSVNGDILNGKYLMNRQKELVKISGTTERELKAIAHCLRTLSGGELQVILLPR